MERSGRTAVRCDFRKRYGDEIAGIVEMHSASSDPSANPASSQEVKATLHAIVADPDAVNLQRIDSLTRALLMDPAWRRLRLRSLDEVTLEQLTDCAQ
jgi:hypothetical protein